jgi:hypothetical protein
MNQLPPSSNRFTPMGKMQQAPAGASILAPINAGTRMVMNFVSLGPSKFDQKLDKMLERIWNKVRQDYFSWSGEIMNFKLGNIKDTLVNSDIMILSLLVRNKEGIVDAVALEKALQKLAAFAKYEKGSIHVSELLVEEVPALKELIKKYIAETGIHCYFYDAPADKK